MLFVGDRDHMVIRLESFLIEGLIARQVVIGWIVDGCVVDINMMGGIQMNSPEGRIEQVNIKDLVDERGIQRVYRDLVGVGHFDQVGTSISTSRGPREECTLMNYDGIPTTKPDLGH